MSKTLIAGWGSTRARTAAAWRDWMRAEWWHYRRMTREGVLSFTAKLGGCVVAWRPAAVHIS
jgi:hypothetical protein